LTTRGDTIIRNATVAARLAIGTDDQHLRSDGTDPLWETVAAGSGAITREGGNTTEATTTSTSAVDMLTAASLTIGATLPFLVHVNFRKTTGAANGAGIGIKLNTTVVGEAHATNETLGKTSTTNQVENGSAYVMAGPRVTNYLRPVSGGFSSHSTITLFANTNSSGNTADLPTAEITDVIIRGISGNALVTLGADELHVYSYAAS